MGRPKESRASSHSCDTWPVVDDTRVDDIYMHSDKAVLCIFLKAHFCEAVMTEQSSLMIHSHF